MQNKKFLLFDFDGTLVDSLLLTKKIVNDLSPKYGYNMLEEKDLAMLRGKNPKEIVKFFKVSLLKLPFIALDFKKAFREELATVSLIKGIKETLETLVKNGFVIGILTSNAKENVEAVLKLHQINCVSFIHADVHIFGKLKSINKAFQKNNIAKEDVMYIGDEIRDIEAAKQAGIKIIAVTWGFNTEEALKKAKPDYVVYEPKELLKICEAFKSK